MLYLMNGLDIYGQQILYVLKYLINYELIKYSGNLYISWRGKRHTVTDLSMTWRNLKGYVILVIIIFNWLVQCPYKNLKVVNSSWWLLVPHLRLEHCISGSLRTLQWGNCNWMKCAATAYSKAVVIIDVTCKQWWNTALRHHTFLL